jgi:hypothetical protein
MAAETGIARRLAGEVSELADGAGDALGWIRRVGVGSRAALIAAILSIVVGTRRAADDRVGSRRRRTDGEVIGEGRCECEGEECGEGEEEGEC